MIQGLINSFKKFKRFMFSKEKERDMPLDQLPTELSIQDFLDSQPDCTQADLW